MVNSRRRFIAASLVSSKCFSIDIILSSPDSLVVYQLQATKDAFSGKIRCMYYTPGIRTPPKLKVLESSPAVCRTLQPSRSKQPVRQTYRCTPPTSLCLSTVAALRKRDKTYRQAILHKLFGNYRATSDFPELYPDAHLALNNAGRRSKGFAPSRLHSSTPHLAYAPIL
jgi:hypothetical protein